MPQDPFAFAFEFESEHLNGNSVTKQSLNYHSAILENSVKWLNVAAPFDQLYPNLMNGNLATVLLPNYHSAVQTQTQTRVISKTPNVYVLQHTASVMIIINIIRLLMFCMHHFGSRSR